MDQVNSAFAEIKAEVVREPLAVKFVPGEKDLAACHELGRIVAERVQALCGSSA